MSNDRIVLDLTGDTDTTTSSGEFAPLPDGWYKVAVYDGELKHTSSTSKNPGSPYYRLQLRVQEGDFAGRVVFDNFVGLYAGAAWKAEQFSRIFGNSDEDSRDEVVVPTLDELTGEIVEARVKKERDSHAEARVKKERDSHAEEKFEEENGQAPDEPIYRNSVTGYRPVGGWPKKGEGGKKAAGGSGKITL